MVDTLEFINGHADIYCGYNIHTFNINELYIKIYICAINNNFSSLYILCVKDKEDKFIISDNQVDMSIQNGVKIL